MFAKLFELETINDGITVQVMHRSIQAIRMSAVMIVVAESGADRSYAPKRAAKADFARQRPLLIFLSIIFFWVYLVRWFY